MRDRDGWCLTCGDEFHLDDLGGYNPPCKCGMHCRSCHEADEYEAKDWADDDDDFGPDARCQQEGVNPK